MALPLSARHVVQHPKPSTGTFPTTHHFFLQALFRGHGILEASPCPEADNRWLESAKGNLGKGKREKAAWKHSVASFKRVKAFCFALCERQPGGRACAGNQEPGTSDKGNTQRCCKPWRFAEHSRRTVAEASGAQLQAYAALRGWQVGAPPTGLFCTTV